MSRSQRINLTGIIGVDEVDDLKNGIILHAVNK